MLRLLFNLSEGGAKQVLFCFLFFFSSQAVTTGIYVEACLNMLIRHFVPPDWVVQRLSQPRVMKQKRDVLSRVHEALLKICILFPYATSGIMLPLTKNMAKINKESQVSFCLFPFRLFSGGKKL